MASPLDNWTTLRDEADRLRRDLIGTELETCRTFANLAATEHEIGDREAAQHCIALSERAHETVIRFLSGVTVDEERRRFESNLKELRETLNDLHRWIGQ